MEHTYEIPSSAIALHWAIVASREQLPVRGPSPITRWLHLLRLERLKLASATRRD